MSSTAVKMLIHFIPGPIPGPSENVSYFRYSHLNSILLLLLGVNKWLQHKIY